MSERDLSAEVHAWLVQHGPARVADIATGIRAADQRVREIIHDVADTTERPAGTDPRAVYYTARPGYVASPRLSRPETHEERLLAVLADGYPHSSRELYRLGLMVHSRVAVLRKRGHMVSCWREGTDYYYLLFRPLDATAAARTSRGPQSPGAVQAVASSGPLGGIVEDQLAVPATVPPSEVAA